MSDTYKYAKMKLISKYSNKIKRFSRVNPNMDSFVTINDFLSNETSLGPNVDPGKINFTYGNYENINNYIKILMKEIGFNKIICMPNYSLKMFDNSIIRNTIGYDVYRDELVIPFDLINELHKCIKKRFIYINLMIFWLQRPISHVNMIIIDNENNTIERYEPHGKSMAHDKNNKMSKNIDEKFSKNVLKYIGLNNYKYISPFDISPVIGIQRKSDAYNGMCLSYSLMYLQLRVMNPDIDQKDIIKYMISKSKQEIYMMILQYAKYIEDKIKEYSEVVLSEQNHLYSAKNFFKFKKFILINKRNEIDTITY